MSGGLAVVVDDVMLVVVVAKALGRMTEEKTGLAGVGLI